MDSDNSPGLECLLLRDSRSECQERKDLKRFLVEVYILSVEGAQAELNSLSFIT